jgi:hypothetical protein
MEMNNEMYNAIKKDIENKKKQTEKEYNINNLKLNEKIEELKDKFIYFNNKIFDIIFPNINLFKEYKKSEYFENLSHSDKIITILKNFILNIKYNEILNYYSKDIKFTEKLEKNIIYEIKNNYKLFYINFIYSQKAKALKFISEIKNKFEDIYNEQEFDITKYVDRIIDIKFEKNEIKEIEEIGKQIIIKKMKEMIEKELEDYD